MAKSIGELLDCVEATFIGDAETQVSGIAYKSTEVKPGDAFFCIVGLKADGHSFAQDAISRGASVIVAQRNLYLADLCDVVVVIVDDTRKAMASASCAFYDHPSKSMQLIGVTGTNGKTTTTYLIEHIARHAGFTTGVIGTVGIKIKDEVVESGRTTPESPDLQKTLARMRDAGCEVVAMEVSSHALDLKRVWGCNFAVCAFTNLTQDHLDYHHTFEAYFEAKSLLFGADYPAKRVIGNIDKWGGRLSNNCVSAKDDVVTFGYSDDDSIHPLEVNLKSNGTDLQLLACNAHYEVSTPLVGRFNVENLMCAFGVALQLGIDGNTITDALSKPFSVPGRIERICTEEGKDNLLPAVYVDYAHTPDALQKAISCVREIADKRTIVVFGCGGDRDREKRPLMGECALKCDYAIVTNDNPRTEDPMLIIDDIVAGMSQGVPECDYEVIPDRACAIKRAIMMASAGDVVLVAGKGHEDYQEGAHGKVHFDDREQVRIQLKAYIQQKGLL